MFQADLKRGKQLGVGLSFRQQAQQFDLHLQRTERHPVLQDGRSTGFERFDGHNAEMFVETRPPDHRDVISRLQHRLQSL